jgi:ribonuclease VapC
MVIDSSILVAIFLDEPDRDLWMTAYSAAARRCISAVNFVETSMVLESRLGLEAGPELDMFTRQTELAIHPVDAQQWEGARQAWRRYGRGNHPAKLNLGDCFAYALARSLGEPLLYKGNDFARTDVRAAL